MTNYHIESDSLGSVKIANDKLWGKNTQRSYNNFKIGHQKMPLAVIYALVLIKKCAAKVNYQQQLLSKNKAMAIIKAADEILSGQYDDQFPLVIYQTGSGTQTNMNVNEVIAALATTFANEKIHPNDDVNLGQSSNDVFPSSMHIVAVSKIINDLLPALQVMLQTLNKQAEKYSDIIKVGRTHLQDATPLTLGQEFSGYYQMLANNYQMIENTLPFLKELALGATAVGTGLNTTVDFGKAMALEIAKETKLPFIEGKNKFQLLASKDAIVNSHASFKTLAASLMKLANDIRWLASGPNCGLNELHIPANELGSSIMPGKINPTQAEALTMVACKVFGNDVCVGMAGSQGNFELNVYMPVMIASYIESIDLLSDAILSFNNNCLKGITVNHQQLQANLDKSLMLVTCLNPYIGYDLASKIAQYAYENQVSLKEAAASLNILTNAEFDKYFDIKAMLKPKKN